jgi:carboxyl-terminal processing protease
MKTSIFILVIFSQCLLGQGHGNFSNLSFTVAFDSLFNNFSTYYPFTEWKAIDWQGLYDTYAPQIANAQSQNDTNAYKLAVRRFIHTFPDGHVRVSGEFQNIFLEEIGGGIGLTLVELEDGSIVVNRVLPGSSAEQEGIKVGATIISWNGLPINEALVNTSLIWEGKPPAINETIRLAQVRRLVRLPVGNQVEITFFNPGQNTVTKTLSAIDDEMNTWDLTNFSRFNTNGSFNLTIDDVLNPVQHSILQSGYGYIKSRILVEFDSEGNVLPTYNNIYNTFKEAISTFNTAQVPGVIIDVRDNPGGFDRLAALLGSFFYDHPDLYEYASFYNPQAEEFEVIGSFTINLEPQSIYYGGPVICLINAGTASSGEGIPMAIKRLAQGHTIGFCGTSGTFGLTSGETLMPGGLSINYPLGRSLDKDYNIQLDSDSTKNGGVIPDIPVPLTAENMIAKYVDSVDVELNYAITYLNSIISLNEENNIHPKEIHLYQNYPNPFNPVTKITFKLPDPSIVSLVIYDITGRQIKTLTSSWYPAGSHQIQWDGRDDRGNLVASGIYVYRINTGNYSQARKMMLLK